MFQRLIIPLDGSPLAEAVLPDAVELARALPAPVVLVHLIERRAPHQIHGQPHLATAREAGPYLDDVERRFFAAEAGGPDFKPVAVEKHVHELAIDDVARSIAEHAREYQSDLVMMCDHGPAEEKAAGHLLRPGWQDEWRKRLFGSIAQHVAASGIAVWLVRQTADNSAQSGANSPGQPGRPPTAPAASLLRRGLAQNGAVLVPLDGSETREAALPAALALARAFRAPLRLLMVAPTRQTLSGAAAAAALRFPAATGELLEQATEDARGYLQAWAEKLSAGDGQAAVQTELRRGDMPEIIAGESAAPTAGHPAGARVALVALGTSARTGLDAYLGGSVAPQVAGQTRVPLLLVPAK